MIRGFEPGLAEKIEDRAGFVSQRESIFLVAERDLFPHVRFSMRICLLRNIFARLW
jgi:hypothetical protein